MATIIFHIGFSKTGTSSLQALLSRIAQKGLGPSRYLYCAIDGDGDVLSGKTLVDLANWLMVGYASSSPLVAETADLNRLRKAIHEICSKGAIPIFSQEDWGRNAHKFQRSRFFEMIDCDVRIIAYVRPQVEWFNAGWWQWFAWQRQFSRPEEVVAAWGYDFMKWATLLKQWKEIPRVRDVIVRLHDRDIVPDFLRQLRIPDIAVVADRKNVGLSPLLIKLYRALPTLRDVHGSEIDAFLSELMDLKGSAPWAVDRHLAERIVDETNSDNLQLLEFFDSDQQAIMRKDRRWWTATAYDGRDLVAESNLEISRDECIAVLARLVPALVKLEKECRFLHLTEHESSEPSEE